MIFARFRIRKLSSFQNTFQFLIHKFQESLNIDINESRDGMTAIL